MYRHSAIVAVLCVPALAFGSGLTNTRDNYRDLRWLGRGNAMVAMVNDGTSLFFNPAGLAIQDAYSFSILNPSLAANQNLYTSAKELTSLTSGGDSLSDRFAPLLGKSMGLEANIFPHLAVPGFAGGFWSYSDLNMLYSNPVNPGLDVQGRTDYGVILGAAFDIHKIFALGFSLRYQRRKEIDALVEGASLIEATSAALTDYLHQGAGWGLSLGAQLRIEPTRYSWAAAGFTVEDLGDTAFRNASGAVTPAKQGQQMNAGLAYGVNSALVDVSFAADMHNIQRSDIHISKRLFMGTEVSLLKFDLRGGFFQGYWTAGLSLRVIPFIDIDLASYGEEAGWAAGQRQNRYYMIGLRTGIGLKGDGSSGGRGRSSKRYRSQLDAL